MFSDGKIFYELCRAILRSEEYGNEIPENSITFDEMQNRKECEEVNLVIPGESTLECAINACICRSYVPKQTTIENNFSVAATNENGSVILLKNTGYYRNELKLYKFIQYFENLDVNYLETYEHY